MKTQILQVESCKGFVRISSNHVHLFIPHRGDNGSVKVTLSDKLPPKSFIMNGLFEVTDEAFFVCLCKNDLAPGNVFPYEFKTGYYTYYYAPTGNHVWIKKLTKKEFNNL